MGADPDPSITDSHPNAGPGARVRLLGRALSATVTPSASPAEFSRFVAAEQAKFQRIVDSTGIRLS